MQNILVDNLDIITDSVDKIKVFSRKTLWITLWQHISRFAENAFAAKEEIGKRKEEIRWLGAPDKLISSFN